MCGSFLFLSLPGAQCRFVGDPTSLARDNILWLAPWPPMGVLSVELEHCHRGNTFINPNHPLLSREEKKIRCEVDFHRQLGCIYYMADYPLQSLRHGWLSFAIFETEFLLFLRSAEREVENSFLPIIFFFYIRLFIRVYIYVFIFTESWAVSITWLTILCNLWDRIFCSFSDLQREKLKTVFFPLSSSIFWGNHFYVCL